MAKTSSLDVRYESVEHEGGELLIVGSLYERRMFTFGARTFERAWIGDDNRFAEVRPSNRLEWEEVGVPIFDY